ncbi:disulfide-isomerase a6, partial [Brachionus plicatilis]
RRHLVKPFVICSSNGRIVDIYGPYQASLNDAEIMKIILNNDKNLMNLIEPKDVFLLDRGFRDCISFLNDRQISTKTPSMTKAKNKQSTFNANMIRHNSKCRWRSFKALRETQNQTLNHIIDDYRVADSLLSEDQLKLIALGTFGLRMCISYLNEALSDGEFEIQINDFVISQMNSKIISTRIQSRHTKSTNQWSIMYNLSPSSCKLAAEYIYCLNMNQQTCF